MKKAQLLNLSAAISAIAAIAKEDLQKIGKIEQVNTEPVHSAASPIFFNEKMKQIKKAERKAERKAKLESLRNSQWKKK